MLSNVSDVISESDQYLQILFGFQQEIDEGSYLAGLAARRTYSHFKAKLGKTQDQGSIPGDASLFFSNFSKSGLNTDTEVKNFSVEFALGLKKQQEQREQRQIQIDLTRHSGLSTYNIAIDWMSQLESEFEINDEIVHDPVKLVALQKQSREFIKDIKGTFGEI
jgi:hypothetical protein